MRASCDFFISRIKCRNRIRYSRFLRGKEVLKTNFYQLASEKISVLCVDINTMSFEFRETHLNNTNSATSIIQNIKPFDLFIF